jgi:dihydrofolate reductase
MSKVICGVAVSLDGFIAGKHMTFEKPMGDMPTNILHKLMFDEPEKHEKELASLTSAGAYIMGRNMFGPKELQTDPDWKGWWGDNPPYHGPVYVLSESEHEPIKMEGGTTFYFVTDGIDSALQKAREAAGDRDIAVAGGAVTINQYLAAGYIDELWLHIAPVTIGEGARLFDNIAGLNMVPIEYSGSELVTHIKYRVVK